MAQRKPLSRFKFTYQTRYSTEHDVIKMLYATTTQAAWIKFNKYCQEHNILLHDASVELL